MIPATPQKHAAPPATAREPVRPGVRMGGRGKWLCTECEAVVLSLQDGCPFCLTTMDKIRQKLAEFKDSPEGVSMELRLSLAEIVLGHLRGQGLDVQKLAARSGLTEAVLSRIFHSDVNLSFDTAGKLLHALGVRARIVVVDEDGEPAR